MHKGTITYHFSDNLGDYIQTLAASKLLGPGPYTHCDREQLHAYHGPEVALLMNGWFMANPKHWPPAQGIRPLMLSMHVNPTAAAGMLTGKGLEYFKKHGQVLSKISFQSHLNFSRLTTLQKENDLDEVYGYNEPSEPGKYTGWLVNMHTGDTLRIVFEFFFLMIPVLIGFSHVALFEFI